MPLGEDHFPAEDVEASLRDLDLQRHHPLSAQPSELQRHLERRRQDAIEGGATERVRWFYFSSPEWTWREECGREGWLLYDPETRTQHGFVMTAMN